MNTFIGFIQDVIASGHRSLVNKFKLTTTATVQYEILAKVVSGGGAGNVIPATSATTRSEIEGICNQTITAPEALTQVPVIEIFENDTFIANLTNNSDAAQNYQRMVLTDSTHVNNTGTDDVNGVVEQVQPFGLPSEKKAIVKFV